MYGIKTMFQLEPLRRSLLLALQVSIAGAFVLVATVNFIKDELGMSDSAYAWVMTLFGLGSAVGAGLYGRIESIRIHHGEVCCSDHDMQSRSSWISTSIRDSHYRLDSDWSLLQHVRHSRK